VRAGVDHRVGPHHAAIGAEQVRDAARPVRVVGIAGAVRLQRAPGVAQQPERQAVLLRERLVLLDGVEARAEDDRAVLLEVAGSITEPVALDRSTRGVGLGVEPQQHVRTREV
jgi:hypothetical protein